MSSLPHSASSAFVEGAETLCCGVGPVEAAAATARALAQRRPEGVLQIGIAGARDLEPGTLVLGSEAIYCDLVDSARSFPRVERAAPDPTLLDDCPLARYPKPSCSRSPRVPASGAGMSAAMSRRWRALPSSALPSAAGVPALELRAVSNRFDADRGDWRIDDAIEALAGAVKALLEAFDA